MSSPSLADRTAALRRHLREISPAGTLESLRSLETIRRGDGLESMSDGPTTSQKRAVELLHRHDGVANEDQLRFLEAIILPAERPVLTIKDSSYDDSPWLAGVLNGAKTRLKPLIRAIGRLDLAPGMGPIYGGTAFLIGPSLLMTNRHVARQFGDGVGTHVTYTPGASWDTLHEANRADTRVLTVTGVPMIHPYWDMALVAIEGDLSGLSPLTLSDQPPEACVGRVIACVGYPAQDSRNDAAVQHQVFQGLYEVKRLMPGKVRNPVSVPSFNKVVRALAHDASTLGGASGSAILDLQTGDVLGLHFGGQYLQYNYGVPAWGLAADERVLRAGVQVRGPVTTSDRPWDEFWSQTEGMSGSLAPSAETARVNSATTVEPGARLSPAPTVVRHQVTLGIPLSIQIELGPVDLRQNDTHPVDANPLDPRRVQLSPPTNPSAADPSAAPPAAGPVPPPAASADAPAPDAPAADAPALTETWEEAEDLRDHLRETPLTSELTETVALGRGDIRLIPDSLSPSLRPVGAGGLSDPFELTAAHLEALAAANHFGPGLADSTDGLVVIALRGCSLADDPNLFPPARDLEDRLGFPRDADRMPARLPLWHATPGFVDRARLVEDTVTHVLPRCLVGVWNRKTGTFALMRGTTAPNWEYSAEAIAERAGRDTVQGSANMLLTGLYPYKVGPHKHLPDALRLQSSDHGVVRPAAQGKQEISYTVADRFWWPQPDGAGVSQDNIHPSFAADGSARRYVFHYSAGCITVQGNFDEARQRHTGAWSVLRSWLGLKSTSVDTAAVGRPFCLMLLTGREARIAATSGAQSLFRLRYGSSGPAVSALQLALAAALKRPEHNTGVFDGETQKRLVSWQWRLGLHRGSADAVLTPAEAALLGVPLTPAGAEEGVEGLFDRLRGSAPVSLPQHDPRPGRRAKALAEARVDWAQDTWTYGSAGGTVTVPRGVPPGQKPTLAWAVQIVPALAKYAANKASTAVASTLGNEAFVELPAHEAVSAASVRRALDLGARAELAAEALSYGAVPEDAEDLVDAAEVGLGEALGPSTQVLLPDAGAEATRPPATLEDYRTRVFRALPVPDVVAEVEAHGLTDERFTRARVCGPNPEMLAAIEQLPAGFSPTLTLNDGEAVEAAAAAGRLFVVEYPLLDTLRPRSAETPPCFCPRPRALFGVSRATGALEPVGIQLADGQPAIARGAPGWTWAKHAVQIADGNQHELVAHLGQTHLVVETFALATYRELAENHPISRLMRPHFEGTVSINNSARNSLIAEGGVIARVFAGTLSSSQDLAVRAVASFDFARAALPDRVARRRTGALLDFPWRDDALRVYGAIQAFVRSYVPLYYPDAATMGADPELQAWMRQLLQPVDKAGVAGFVRLETPEALADALTLVIYTASAQHAAVNFPQYPEMAYAPLLSGAAWSDTPVNTSDERAMLELFPPIDLAREQAEMLFLLSAVYHTQLGHYRSRAFDDRRVEEGLLPAFQAELARIEAQITADNRGRRWAYEHLLPSRIPQSINI